MTRQEALAIATEHVNTIATNARGYQDGVRFADKIAAIERLARYLTEPEPAGDDNEGEDPASSTAGHWHDPEAGP